VHDADFAQCGHIVKVEHLRVIYEVLPYEILRAPASVDEGMRRPQRDAPEGLRDGSLRRSGNVEHVVEIWVVYPIAAPGRNEKSATSFSWSGALVIRNNPIEIQA